MTITRDELLLALETTVTHLTRYVEYLNQMLDPDGIQGGVLRAAGDNLATVTAIAESVRRTTGEWTAR
jgi:hypothetical protein